MANGDGDANSDRGRSRRWFPGLVLAFAFAGWVACNVYGKDLLLPAPPQDAGTPPAPAPAPDANTCDHAHWLARPATDDPGTGPSSSVVVALATFVFGETDAGPPPLVGYDLDNVCTCPGPDSCVNTISPSPHCDDDGGRDNAGGHLLDLLSAFPGISQSALDDNLSHGTFGFVIQIKGWNGQPNDTEVTAAVYVSSGLADVDGGHGTVKGDGTDVWAISSDSVLGGTALEGTDCGNDNPACSPVYIDDEAYVANGVLICSLDFPIAVGSPSAGTVQLDLTGSVIAAPLVQATGGWSIQNGVIDGRWATKSLLSSLAALPDPLSTTGQYLCGQDLAYTIAKNQICGAMDIAADPKLDQTGAPCDAVSIAIGFSAHPAQMGTVSRRIEPAQGCTSEAGTPFSDSCDNP